MCCKLCMEGFVAMDNQMNIRKRSKYCVSFIITCVLMNECLVYVLMPWVQWPPLTHSPLDSVKLLLVGDPQLLGKHFTSFSIFGYLARWDSDRFVSKTFHLAYNYMNPDIIIFLGDILDEGEISTDDEFLQYFKRFQSVFHSIDFNKAIIVPGDNDIGGENEPPSIENERRFDKYFKNDDFVKYKFLEFVKINYMTQSNNYLSIPSSSEDTFRIVISHIPLTSMYSGFTEKVFTHLQPHLILSAHEHTSNRFVAVRKSGIRTYNEIFFQSAVHIFNITETETQEIMVPTCSYRMGTDKMGYGALVISKNGEIVYGVLWLPSRFLQLYLYLGLCLLIILAFVPPPFWSFFDSLFFNRRTSLLLPHGKNI